MLAPSLRKPLGKIRQYLAHSLERGQLLIAHIREASRPAREVRGIALLREWLSADQLGQFSRYGYFEVTGCQTGKRYRVLYATGTNIHELDEYGHPVIGWCFVPVGSLVPGDVMLAQKIALETDESAALQVAKSFRPTWC
jgi:hypothetical protein